MLSTNRLHNAKLLFSFPAAASILSDDGTVDEQSNQGGFFGTQEPESGPNTVLTPFTAGFRAARCSASARISHGILLPVLQSCRPAAIDLPWNV